MDERVGLDDTQKAQVAKDLHAKIQQQIEKKMNNMHTRLIEEGNW
jgi:hypothetical protein